MKPMICITVTLTAILSLSGLATAGMLLLSDDFESYDLRSDAFPVWLTHSGKWMVMEEGFQGTDCDGSFIAQGASTGEKGMDGLYPLAEAETNLSRERLAGRAVDRLSIQGQWQRLHSGFLQPGGGFT